MINKLITLKEVKSEIIEAQKAIKIQDKKSSKAQLKKYKLKNEAARLTRYKKNLENELKEYLYKKEYRIYANKTKNKN
jgi:methionine-rich copper-binding protein CopC